MKQIKTNMTSEGRLGGSWFVKILCFNLNEYKKAFLINAKNPKWVWVYIVWSSVLYSISSLLQDSNFNPESHSESYEVLRIKKKTKTKENDERAAFLSLCLAAAACPLITSEKKGGHGTFHISSVAQPPRGRVANQIIINTGIHMGFWGGTIFLMHTHKHTSDGDYELSKTLLSALNSYSLQCNSMAANR